MLITVKLSFRVRWEGSGGSPSAAAGLLPSGFDGGRATPGGGRVRATVVPRRSRSSHQLRGDIAFGKVRRHRRVPRDRNKGQQQRIGNVNEKVCRAETFPRTVIVDLCAQPQNYCLILFDCFRPESVCGSSRVYF